MEDDAIHGMYRAVTASRGAILHGPDDNASDNAVFVTFGYRGLEPASE